MHEGRGCNKYSNNTSKLYYVISPTHITLVTFMTFLILYLIPPTSNMMFPNKTEGNPRCAAYISCRVLASASRPSINRDKLRENLGLYVCCFLGCC